MSGRKWKNATDANGVKIPEGQHRDDPWIVVAPVDRAIAIVEALHDSPLLFPVAILERRSTDRNGSRSGLVAAEIQYGHLKVQITQGYSGTYASGFPDDLAFERWLARLDELAEADRRLRRGEHISGPAADAYRSRVAGGAGRFAGRVIRNGSQARHVLANPSLPTACPPERHCTPTAS